MTRIILRRMPPAALVALGLALAACGPVNRGLDSVHQPVVSRVDYVMDVNAGYGGLAAGEADRLGAWFDSLELGYGDRIAVDGSPDGSVRDDVASVAARYGLLLADSAPVTAGAIQPGTARVVVSRAQARVDGCPDWSRMSQPEFAGSTTSNYGCAVNSNLAAMVANPEDLVRGQATAGSDARTVTKAITTYREMPSTGRRDLKDENTRKGSE